MHSAGGSCLALACMLNFHLPGTLELVDRPADATPVEFLSVTLHPLAPGRPDLHAQPDRGGQFVLRDLSAGRYSLVLSFPGRIRAFLSGARELTPDRFELDAKEVGPLRIVVSLKTSELKVSVSGVPAEHGDIAVLLAPADAYLTLRESCFLNSLTGRRTIFLFVPPGRYRIFAVDARFQTEVAAYGPRFPDFLRDEAPAVYVHEETEAAATYINAEAVQAAIRTITP